MALVADFSTSPADRTVEYLRFRASQPRRHPGGAPSVGAPCKPVSEVFLAFRNTAYYHKAMRVRSRQRASYIMPGATDLHISRAITDPERFVERTWETAEGTVYRVFGYTYPIAGPETITLEDAHGTLEAMLMDVTYLDVEDRGEEADVLFAREMDAEDRWNYG